VDYKKIIKNQEMRFKILGFLDFLPDKIMLQLQYRIKTGRKLNLKSPKRYTEKLQWYKLYYRDPLMTKCADKFSVREYVKSKGLSEILNPLYGVYEDEKDIDFDELPNSFAIKHTNGSGANVFIEDKNKLDTNDLKETLRGWMTKRKVNYGREWCYYNVKPRIIVEKLLDRDENNDLPDYKFFCFNGKVKYLYTMIDYVDNHEEGRCSFFTPDFKKLPYRRSEYKEINKELRKPQQFEKMIEIAENLSKDFPHARVDLYNIKGQIIFGELTFYNASGYTVFTPDEFDFILGKEFNLPNEKTN
jgi:TupA-like ATPgrasp